MSVTEVSAMTLVIEAETIPIVQTADGAFRIGKTRVTLDTLIVVFNQGLTPEEIVQQFPTLKLADVYATITYYLRHQSEVDDFLKQRRIEAERLQAQIEANSDYRLIRKRLIERREKALN